MPLDDGIWRYTENDVAAPAFSDLLNLLGDSVRESLNASASVGTFTPVNSGAGNRVASTGFYVRRRGDTVFLDGALTITAAGATSFGAGGTYGLATLSSGFAPALTGVQLVVPAPRGTTGPGYLTLIISAGSGIISVRNDSGAATTLAAGNEIRLSLNYLAA